MAQVRTAYEVWSESGLRQAWVAERMGVRRDTLNNWLRGRRPWTAEARAAFAQVVGVPEAEIDFAHVVPDSGTEDC